MAVHGLHLTFAHIGILSKKQRYLCIKIQRFMEDFKITKIDAVSVEMHTRAEQMVPSRILRGRALYNEEDVRLTFVQNESRPNRSKEILRTAHSRCVLRPDGKYTLTFRFEGNEYLLRETLISEVRTVVNQVQQNMKLQPLK